MTTVVGDAAADVAADGAQTDDVPRAGRHEDRQPPESGRAADRPLDNLAYEDVRLRGYDPAPGIEFAVAE